MLSSLSDPLHCLWTAEASVVSSSDGAAEEAHGITYMKGWGRQLGEDSV